MTKILLGVTGGIAAYKAVDLCSALLKTGYEVKVIMTEAAKKIIPPLTLATICKAPIYDDSSEWAVARMGTQDIEHITLSKWMDMLVVAPATANTIAKFAHGIADNLLTCTYLATPVGVAVNKKIVIFPAMNTSMWGHPATQKNIQILRDRWNHTVVMPAVGMLACGDTGVGKLPSVKEIVEKIGKLIKE